jgi:hypothetical protein
MTPTPYPPHSFGTVPVWDLGVIPLNAEVYKLDGLRVNAEARARRCRWTQWLSSLGVKSVDT